MPKTSKNKSPAAKNEPGISGLKAQTRELKAENTLIKRQNKGLSVRVEYLSSEKNRIHDNFHNTKLELKQCRKELAECKAALVKTKKQLAWFVKEKFTDGTEIVPADLANTSSCAALTPTTTRRRGQQIGNKGPGRSDRSGLETEEYTHSLKSNHCTECLKPFKVMPETDDSSLVQIATWLVLEQHRQQRYVAACSCEKRKIITAPAPQKLYPRTTIGNSLWSHLFLQRYLFGQPMNRLLKQLALKGLPLAAGTVTGGLKRLDEYFDGLYEGIKTHCQKADLWNADETSWRVFEDENGDRNKKPWWLWLFASKDAIVFILDESRSRKVPENFLSHSAGVLLSDRYSAYKPLKSEINKAYCWVHQRRDFLKIFTGMPGLRNWARQWLVDIGKLFAANHVRFRHFCSTSNWGQTWEPSQHALEEVIEEIRKRMEQQLAKPTLEPEQRKVLNSLKKHWMGLTMFVNDPRIAMDNNRAEQLLRGPVVNRKNSYGSGSEWGGHLCAKMFTIFQTWIINGLNPETLLDDFFEECSKLQKKPPAQITAQFLPWTMSADRRSKFALPSSYH